MKKSLSRIAIIAAMLAPVAGYAQQAKQNYSNTNLGPAVAQAQNTAAVPMVREEIWASGWSGKIQYRDVPMYKQPKAPKPHCGVFQTCPGVTKIGLGKGDFILRAGALGVIPNNTSSRTSVGGHVTASNGVMGELSANYFITDNLAVEAIASSTQHKVWARGTAAGDVYVGKVWVIPPTITLQWHFLPHKRFNPYAGVGLTVAFWHNLKPGGGIVQKLGMETTVGPSFNIGFDYQLVGNWFFNIDAKQMLLNQRAHINNSPDRIDARTSLNPTAISGGIGYRF